MGNPLKDHPEVETVDEDDEDLAPHLRNKPKKGESTAENPFDFTFDKLRTDNPTESGLAPEEMIERTFLMPPEEDGSRYRAKIMAIVDDHMNGMNNHPNLVRFRGRVNNKYDEIVAYSDISDYIEKDRTWEGIHTFDNILGHKEVKPGDPDYKGCQYNILVEWSTGERTWEPLHTKDKAGVWDTDPVTVAIYAHENNLLDTPGWRLGNIRALAKT